MVFFFSVATPKSEWSLLHFTGKSVVTGIVVWTFLGPTSNW